jgi:phosphate transport system protein
METSDLKHHYSQQFNSELEDIRSRVLGMGGLVESQLGTAISALTRGESDSAEAVVTNDSKVNAFDLEIDQRCTTILALRQPTASDLRLVLAVFKTTADLERIGDEAKRVASMVIRVVGDDHENSLLGPIVHLGERVQQMLHNALDAFARMDLEAAINVVDEDINIDREYENVVRQSTTRMQEDPSSIPEILDMIWAARGLERIGDRCCNISEYIIYFVTGKDVRHDSLEQIKKELGS